MKIHVEDNEIVLTEVYSGVLLKTDEGHAIGICQRDGTFEINVIPKEARENERNWHTVDMYKGTIDKHETPPPRVQRVNMQDINKLQHADGTPVPDPREIKKKVYKKLGGPLTCKFCSAVLPWLTTKGLERELICHTCESLLKRFTEAGLQRYEITPDKLGPNTGGDAFPDREGMSSSVLCRECGTIKPCICDTGDCCKNETAPSIQEAPRTDKLQSYVATLTKELYGALEASRRAARKRGDKDTEEELLSKMDEVWKVLGPEDVKVRLVGKSPTLSYAEKLVYCKRCGRVMPCACCMPTVKMGPAVEMGPSVDMGPTVDIGPTGCGPTGEGDGFPN